MFIINPLPSRSILLATTLRAISTAVVGASGSQAVIPYWSVGRGQAIAVPAVDALRVPIHGIYLCSSIIPMSSRSYRNLIRGLLLERIFALLLEQRYLFTALRNQTPLRSRELHDT